MTNANRRSRRTKNTILMLVLTCTSACKVGACGFSAREGGVTPPSHVGSICDALSASVGSVVAIKGELVSTAAHMTDKGQRIILEAHDTCAGRTAQVAVVDILEPETAKLKLLRSRSDRNGMAGDVIAVRGEIVRKDEAELTVSNGSIL